MVDHGSWFMLCCGARNERVEFTQSSRWTRSQYLHDVDESDMQFVRALERSAMMDGIDSKEQELEQREADVVEAQREIIQRAHELLRYHQNLESSYEQTVLGLERNLDREKFKNKTMREESKGLHSKGKCSSTIGSIYGEQVERKLVQYQTRLADCDPRDVTGRANAHMKLGRLFNDNLYNLSEASSHFVRAIKLYRSINDKDGELAALRSAVETFLELGEYQKALESAQRRCDILRRVDCTKYNTAFMHVQRIKLLINASHTSFR